MHGTSGKSVLADALEKYAGYRVIRREYNQEIRDFLKGEETQRFLRRMHVGLYSITIAPVCGYMYVSVRM